MKNLYASFVTSLLVGAVSALAGAQTLDPSFSSGNTLIEPGVDLRDYVSDRKTPPMTVDGFGYIWVIADKGRTTPLLLRVNRQGVIDARIEGFGRTVEEMQKFGTTRNGDLLFCGVNSTTHRAVVSRYRTLAYGEVALAYQTEVQIPPPYTYQGDIFFPSENPRVVTPISCVEDATGAVVFRFNKSGNFNGDTYYARLLGNGALDASFGGSGLIKAGVNFGREGIIYFGAPTIDWLDADGTINLVTEGALQGTLGVFTHPAAVWRLRPPSATSSAWTTESKDLSFQVDPTDFGRRFVFARYVDNENIVFVAQPDSAGSRRIANVYRVDKTTGVRMPRIQPVYLPLFQTGALLSFSTFTVDGKALLFGVNTSDGAVVGFPISSAQRYQFTLWIKRLDAGGSVQSVAAGLAIAGFVSATDVRVLPDGGFVLASAGLITRDEKNAVPGLVRFPPDYLNPRTSEFVDTKRGTYFFSADTDEIEQIWQWTRDGILADWKPSRYVPGAQSFKVWPLDRVSPIQTSAACRFFASSIPTHFYASSTQECATLATGEWAKFFAAESPNFAMSYPSSSGSCESGTLPVRRFFSGKPPLNHRWVTTASETTTMLSLGWIDEGVQLCALR